MPKSATKNTLGIRK